VAWRNDDGISHRIVANDGSFDTGNIGAGQTSAAMTMPAGGINYHCSIHPSMVGAIGDPGGGAPPPCTGIYC
jgi:plastocyanin